MITSGNSSTISSNQQQFSNRPSSAYFNNTTKANILTNNGSNSTLSAQQMPLHYVMGPNASANVGNVMQQHQMHATANNRAMNAFVRDAQNQQSLRMNQMMAPSMPNIAHSSGYQSNISSSQSMQNVNMIHPNYYVQPSPNTTAANYPNGYGIPDSQQPQQPQTLDLAELRRRGQQIPMYSLDVNVQNSMPNLSAGSMLISPNGHPNDPHHAQSYRANPSLNKTHASQPGINYLHNSPVKQLPPTAPKPQVNRQSLQTQFKKEEISPPLPPSATHPLLKITGPNYSATLPPPKNFIGTNPWEREQREKEQEIRREQSRQWREYQIIELTNMQHRTPQQEEQLKTLILERDFERMAEEQEDLEDENDTPYGKDNVHEVIRLTQNTNQMPTPMTNMKQIDVKMNVLSQSQSSSASLLKPSDTISTNENGITSQSTSGMTNTSNAAATTVGGVQPKSILKHNNARNDRNISNSNPSSPSKQGKTTSFADDRQSAENGIAPNLSGVVRDLNNLNFNDYDPNSTTTTTTVNYTVQEIRKETIETTLTDVVNNNGPPPPPERNSSYVIMSQKQQNLRNNNIGIGKSPLASMASPIASSSESIINQLIKKPTTTTTAGLSSPNNNNNINNNNNNGNGTISTPTQSVTNLSLSTMMANRDNKRVSFHDEDNNPISSQLNLSEQTIEDPNVSSTFVINYYYYSRNIEIL